MLNFYYFHGSRWTISTDPYLTLKIKNHLEFFFSLGFVSCKSFTTNPSFIWLEDVSSDGIPLLQIDFHDGGVEDVALLSPFNPIPQGPTERSEEIDPCIYEGYLKNEKDVYVTLTGCPLSESFQVGFPC